MSNYFIDEKGKQKNQDDMQDAQDWASRAMQKRLGAIRNEGGAVMPYVEQKLSELNLRRMEGNQTGDPLKAWTGQTPQAQSRAQIMDQEVEAAQKAYQESQKTPNQ